MDDDDAMIVSEPDDDSLMEIDELPSTKVSLIYFQYITPVRNIRSCRSGYPMSYYSMLEKV